MGVMLYKQGRGTRVWGKEFKSIIVEEDAVSDHLKEGWHEHPDEVNGESVNQGRIKRTRKTKAESDADSD